MTRPIPFPARAPAAALLALALAACGTAPRTLPPPAPQAPAAWQAPLPAGSAELVSWWTRFNDPALPPLIAAAQAASPTLASAAARVERARALRQQAGVLDRPGVSLSADASHGRSALGVPITTNAAVGAQLSWEIDLFGALAAGRDAAQARLEGAQAAWHGARVALAAEVASSYAALRACEAQALQSQIDADSRAETSRLTGLSADAGFTAPADAALARAGAAQSRSQAANQRAACEQIVKSLVEATAVPEPELRQRLAASAAVLPQPQPLGVAALPAQLLQQRPDLAEAARNVVAAAGDHAQARARELPQVSLSGSLFAASARTGGSGGQTLSGSTWSLGPLVVNFPLFDGGYRAADTAAALASYNEAIALYQAALRRAVREVESALVSLQATAQREGDARSAAQDFEAALRATEARQKGGLASLLELETSRRNAAQAQLALIDLLRQRTEAWIALYRSLGGGWNDGELNTASAPAATRP